jgi:hypothetical protein
VGKLATNEYGRADTRRQFLKMAGVSVATASAVGLTSCSPPWQQVAGAGLVVGGFLLPEGWLADLAYAVGAAEIVNILNDGLQYAWQAWSPGIKSTLREILANGRYLPGGAGWGHPVPPTVMVRTSATKSGNPRSDQMVAFVDYGQNYITFKPWAWQTLWAFIHSLTGGLSGADLDIVKTACALTLLPSGTAPEIGHSPENTVSWMTYQSHNGSVEIALARETDSSMTGIITASAIPGSDGNPLTQSFSLPAT